MLCAQRSPDDFPKDDFRRSIPRYSHESFPNILKLCDGLAALGRKHNASAGQVALAWLLEQGPDVIPIPGTRSIKVSSGLRIPSAITGTRFLRACIHIQYH